ncbi:putative Peptidase, membrane zinc metallopeptidase [Candidatus Filomicrobium marinum]|uniref:Putative Peptidase, membrane zinc metallopeptidase n=1 Tax=Candidatus Filomicrobium marinum TaxID=1608628 RepID=A0A0D6JEN6_9HYPH|nr:zinc metallopeptidase [Candidatus Filomicrobium marinum]CFX22122.1 putative Peptidase, membrane zinc metallopeptidase [Candidatus Filomicrobium marinum]CPR18870.1 putative Peptidase, membrane zinc metallopeptidase [Candidatus Filomicrobium marinum]
MVIALVLIAGVFALAYLPQLWVQRVIEAHSDERSDFPGTGGEFARHLLDGMNLTHVKVEPTNHGDHYDPATKTVRLVAQRLNGRSLSAVVIAAHEVGHAMQDATGYAPLAARTRMARQAQAVERIGSIVMLAAPVVMILTKAPFLLLMQMVAGVLILGSTILMHAVTLPVEFDASFSRALPLLKAGRYVREEDLGSARKILRAAAFTYVAAAAMSVLDVMRWFRVLRF